MSTFYFQVLWASEFTLFLENMVHGGLRVVFCSWRAPRWPFPQCWAEIRRGWPFGGHLQLSFWELVPRNRLNRPTGRRCWANLTFGHAGILRTHVCCWAPNFSEAISVLGSPLCRKHIFLFFPPPPHHIVTRIQPGLGNATTFKVQLTHTNHVVGSPLLAWGGHNATTHIPPGANPNCACPLGATNHVVCLQSEHGSVFRWLEHVRLSPSTTSSHPLSDKLNDDRYSLQVSMADCQPAEPR